MGNLELNKIYCMDCIEGMKLIDKRSVALVVTSPPYYNLREYSHWDTYKDYLSFCLKTFKEFYRIIRPSGWVAWNTQSSIPFPESMTGKERYNEPVTADITNMLKSVGFVYENRIAWHKGMETYPQRMFGSYPYPPTIIISNITEDIILVRKKLGNYKLDRTKKGRSKFIGGEWRQWAIDFWHIPPAKASKIGHPAPFPTEIPKRLIKLLTFVGDTVLDPFIGSGTTVIACKRLNRDFIGFDTKPEYVEMANKRLKNTSPSLKKILD